MDESRPDILPPDAQPFFETLGKKAGFFADHPSIFLWLLLGMALIAAFMMFAIRFRRPKPFRPAVPVTRLPDWISPSAVRYVMQKGFDTKCITIALVNASLKGCYHIRWSSRGFQAQRLEGADFTQLTEDERRALALYKDHYRDRITVTSQFRGMARKMANSMDEYYSITYRRFFRHKLWALAIAIGLTFLFSASLLAGFGLAEKLPVWAGFQMLLWVFVVIPIYFFSQIFRDRYWAGIAYCLLFVFIGISGLVALEQYSNAPLISPLVVPLTIIPFVFSPWLSTYTVTGQRMMNLVDSYKEYLNHRFDLAEKNQIDRGQLLEELPYAMALDLDYRLTPYFRNLLSRSVYEPFQMFDRSRT